VTTWCARHQQQQQQQQQLFSSGDGRSSFIAATRSTILIDSPVFAVFVVVNHTTPSGTIGFICAVAKGHNLLQRTGGDRRGNILFVSVLL